MAIKDNRISELLRELKSPDDTIRLNAAQKLGEIEDERIVAPLVEGLRDSNLGVQQAVMDSLIRLGTKDVVYHLLPYLRDEKASIRNMTVEILENIGSSGIELMTPLLRDEDEDIRKFVTDILGKIGGERVVEPLIEVLNDANPNVRAAAVNSLGMLKDKRAVEPILRLLDDEDWVRFYAIGALGNIGDKRAVKPLMNMIEREEGSDRYAVIEALGKIGDPMVLKPIISLLEGEDIGFRNQIIKTVIPISKDSPDLLLNMIDKDRLFQYLTDAMSDSDREIRISAIKGLEMMGDKKGTGHLLDLLETIKDDEEMRELIYKTLQLIADEDILIERLNNIPLVDGKLSDDATILIPIKILGHIRSKKAIPILLSIMRDQNREIRREIISTLRDIGDRSALPVITKALEDETGHIRKEAALTLGSIGGREAIRPLLALFEREPYRDVMEGIVMALVELDSDEVIDSFIQLSSHNRIDVRELAVRGLGLLKDTRGMPALLNALNDVDWRVRRSAIDSLSCFDDPKAIESMLLGLSDEHEQVRLSSVQNLSRLYNQISHSKEIIDNLIMSLGDSYLWVRYRAAEAIGRYRDTDSLIPLINTMKKEDGPVRLMCIWALGEIGDKKAEDELRDLLALPEEEVKKEVIDALEKIKGGHSIGD